VEFDPESSCDLTGKYSNSSLSEQRPQRAATANLRRLERIVADIDEIFARDQLYETEAG
jgi:hypothetical protein